VRSPPLHTTPSSAHQSQIQRNATVRAVTHTLLGAIFPKDFYLWHKFRTFLLMKAVPLIRTLPQSDQLEMYSLLQHQEFQDGEFIIRQGDVGDKFYIITGGAADVVEESFDGFYFRRDVLTRLYEGHFFGEMAIIYDEPRVASVVAVGRTSCLYLSKAAFREALSTQQFHMMMQATLPSLPPSLPSLFSSLIERRLRADPGQGTKREDEHREAPLP
jgi:CRP-like cAMP-binding protein